jgi:hypothetical protein
MTDLAEAGNVDNHSLAIRMGHRWGDNLMVKTSAAMQRPFGVYVVSVSILF